MTPSNKPGPNPERVGIANFVGRDHAPDFIQIEGATIDNRFAFIALTVRARLNRACKKKVAVLIGEAGRGKIMAE